MDVSCIVRCATPTRGDFKITFQNNKKATWVQIINKATNIANTSPDFSFRQGADSLNKYMVEEWRSNAKRARGETVASSSDRIAPFAWRLYLATTPPTQVGFPMLGFPSWVSQVGFPKLVFPSWVSQVGFPKLGFPSWLPQVGFPKLVSPSWFSQVGFPKLGFPSWASQVGFPKLGFPSWFSQVGFLTPLANQVSQGHDRRNEHIVRFDKIFRRRGKDL
jgi:hypothetical protein